MTSLRIAYLCLQATTEGQASHAHVHEIIKGLRAAGHAVDLHEPRYAGRPAPNALRRLVEFARIQWNLVQNLGDYDVLYVRGHPLAMPASYMAKRRGITTIQECNGPYDDFVQAWPAARPFAGLLAAMAREQFGAADSVVAVTSTLSDWVKRESGQREVVVVPNGANTDLFTPDHPKDESLPERYAVFFGAMQPWQGIPTILDAVRRPEWPEDLPVVFVGDGLLAGEVRAAETELPGRVRYLGRLPHLAVAPVVSNATMSLVGFTRRRETGGAGSPVKLYESIASGVPVVAGDIPGQAEVIRAADCGVLIDPITPQNLALAVARLAADPELAKEMGRRARHASVNEHSWAIRGRRVAELLADAHARRSTSLSVAPRIAYVSLQAVVDGQDTWAAVTEIIKGIEADGWTVDRYFPHYRGETPPGILTRLVEMYSVQRRLSKQLDAYDALYVRAHQMAWPIAKLARGKGIPVIQECNGPYDDLYIAWPSTRLARPLFEYLQRSQYREASAIVSVSQGLTDWLIADTGNTNVITNGNGANIEAFTPDAPRREGLPEQFAVFFGQFPAWQGIGTLLEAVRLPEWPEDLPLVFVGDGAMRPAIEQAARELPGRVVYLGRLPYAEVAHVAAHAVVSYVPMVAPEREAKFSPLKLYESMACGVPVIASDTIGISEVVNETECGILVQPGDAHGIASATTRLLADPKLAAEMGRRGRRAAVERFSWRARSRERREVIESAMGCRRESARGVA